MVKQGASAGQLWRGAGVDQSGTGGSVSYRFRWHRQDSCDVGHAWINQAQGAAYPIVSSLFSKSDFTNRMCVGVSGRSGRNQRHPCRAVPEIAIHGDFNLGIQHSASEIADFSQRLETIGYAVPCAW